MPQSIFKSASKMVFFLIALTVCGVFAYQVVMGKATLDPKDFMALALMAFTFYFSSKGETKVQADDAQIITGEDTTQLPFAGK